MCLTMFLEFCWVKVIRVISIHDRIDSNNELFPEWLAEEIGKAPATVSKWCTNTAQPDLPTLVKIASLLDVDVKDLICSTKSTNENIIIIHKP